MHARISFSILPFLLALAPVLACDAQVDNNYSGEPLALIRGSVSSAGQTTGADVAVLWFSDSFETTCSGPSINCGGGGGGDTDPTTLACVDACGAEPNICNAEEQLPYQACLEECGWWYGFSIDWSLCVGGASGERVSVTGDFPSAFTLTLYQPPPAEALISDAGGLRVAYGWFIVADPNVETVTFAMNEPPPSAIIGGTDTHVLIYAADPIPVDSDWGQFLGGSYDVGYHVLEVVPGLDCGEVMPQPGDPPCISQADAYKPTPNDLGTELSVELTDFESIDWPSL